MSGSSGDDVARGDPSATGEWIVPESLAGERVDRAIALVCGWSRAEAQEAADQGGVVVDGRPVRKSQRLVAGQRVAVRARPGTGGPPGPEDVPIEVRYEDPDVLVVAKPAGIVVHPGPGHPHGTLVHGLLARDPGLASVGDPDRPGIVHRLDRDTSGLMLVARTPEAYTALVAALSRHEVEREYVALVWGHPQHARGVVDAPIGRAVSRRTRMAVRREGRTARTAYAVRDRFVDPEVAVLDCVLETGRTHQIRVHLAAIGHPVVGDGTYGGKREAIVLDRPFLHAARLRLRHPRSGEELGFEEPLPPELATLLEQLRVR